MNKKEIIMNKEKVRKKSMNEFDKGYWVGITIANIIWILQRVLPLVTK